MLLQTSAALLLLPLSSWAQQSAYGQCGGQGWTGSTACVSGYELMIRLCVVTNQLTQPLFYRYYCSAINSYYSQCVPGSAATNSSRATTSTSVITTSGSVPGSSTTRASSSTVSSSAPSSSASGGDGAWSAAYSKARTALANLSNQDKVNIVTGIGWTKGPCVGNTAAVSSIGYPSLCLQDGPLGVRYPSGVTAFPAGLQAASTWDISLINQRGAALGAEAKALGVHVQLGPVAGPLGKIPNGGRGWEGFSVDPYETNSESFNHSR